MYIRGDLENICVLEIILLCKKNVCIKTKRKERKKTRKSPGLCFCWVVTSASSLGRLICVPPKHYPQNEEHYRRLVRGTQREYGSKPLKHSIVERILVFKR